MRVDETTSFKEVVFNTGDTLKGEFNLTRSVGDLGYSSQIMVTGRVSDPGEKSWYLQGSDQVVIPLSSVLLLKS